MALGTEFIYSSKFDEKVLKPMTRIYLQSPRKVSIEVTTRCQLNCVYCTRDKSKEEDLTLVALRQMESKLSGVKEIVICGIGESFCYPYLYEALEILKNYQITIITNGAIPIHFEMLNQYGNVKVLIFSIDATTEDKMKAICVGYHFENLLDNLEQLKKYPNIAGVVNTTLVVDNLEEIPTIVDFAKEHGLVAVNFELPIGNEEFTSTFKLQIQKKIKEGMERAKQKQIIFNPFYRISCHSKGCLNPNITLNGDFYPCCNAINQGYSTGNIFEERIDQLWESKTIPYMIKNQICTECKLVKNLWKVLEGDL